MQYFFLYLPVLSVTGLALWLNLCIKVLENLTLLYSEYSSYVTEQNMWSAVSWYLLSVTSLISFQLQNVINFTIALDTRRHSVSCQNIIYCAYIIVYCVVLTATVCICLLLAEVRWRLTSSLPLMTSVSTALTAGFPLVRHSSTCVVSFERPVMMSPIIPIHVLNSSASCELIILFYFTLRLFRHQPAVSCVYMAVVCTPWTIKNVPLCFLL